MPPGKHQEVGVTHTGRPQELTQEDSQEVKVIILAWQEPSDMKKKHVSLEHGGGAHVRTLRRTRPWWTFNEKPCVKMHTISLPTPVVVALVSGKGHPPTRQRTKPNHTQSTPPPQKPQVVRHGTKSIRFDNRMIQVPRTVPGGVSGAGRGGRCQEAPRGKPSARAQ